VGRKILSLTSSVLGILLFLAPQLLSQEVPATTDSTITLTNNVEVYSYEDLTFTIENYVVAPGESIEGILRKQGIWPEGADDGTALKLVKLVSELNPVVPNLDQINPGQTLYLPRLEEKPPEPLQTIAPDEDDPSVVVTYNLSSPEQSPARVVVKRQTPETDPAPAQDEPLPEGTYALRTSGNGDANSPDAKTSPTVPAAQTEQAKNPASEPTTVTTRESQRDSLRRGNVPSQNEGPVDISDDGTAFRTIKVKRGDTLERLLRREGIDPRSIYREYIKVTVKLNPKLRNPNLIIAGAELKIPLSEDNQMAFARGGGQIRTGSDRVVSDAGGNTVALTSPTGESLQAQAAQSRGEAVASKGSPQELPKTAALSSPKNDSKGNSKKDSPKKDSPKFRIDTKRLPAAAMPTADSQNARTVLSVIFTRLGEEITTQGRLFLPLDEPPHYDYDMSSIPLLKLKNGRKVILDLQRKLSESFITRFRAKYNDYMVFQPKPKETMAQALDRLWPMCGYYRVFGKDRAFEGGRDLKLKISADWLVWPTQDDWKKGQPVVINLAPSQDNGTPQPWVKFLNEHNITVIDLYQGLLAGSTKGATPINNFMVIEVEGDNPSAFAAALVKSFGFSPRIGVNVDLSAGRIATGGEALGKGLTPPVFWENGESRIILEYGELTTEELSTLRDNGFQVISSAKDIQSVLKSILAENKIKLGGDLVLDGDSSGGPSISLTITGETFHYNDRTYLFTPVALPGNMTGLDPNQIVVVLRYQPQSPARPLPAPPQAAPTGDTPTQDDALAPATPSEPEAGITSENIS
jgi:hypothetical protein